MPTLTETYVAAIVVDAELATRAGVRAGDEALVHVHATLLRLHDPAGPARGAGLRPGLQR